MATKLNVINNALILIGDLPLQELLGTTRAHVASAAIYDRVVRAELNKFPWSFARKKASLNKVAETIVGTEFTTMYELPSDFIFMQKLNPISLRYQIYGNRIYTNYSATLYVDYIYNAPEDQWTAGFEDLMVSRLAMDLAPAIRDSATSMQLNAAQYEIASRMARASDSMQSPVQPIRSNPIVAARF